MRDFQNEPISKKCFKYCKICWNDKESKKNWRNWLFLWEEKWTVDFYEKGGSNKGTGWFLIRFSKQQSKKIWNSFWLAFDLKTNAAMSESRFAYLWFLIRFDFDSQVNHDSRVDRDSWQIKIESKWINAIRSLLKWIKMNQNQKIRSERRSEPHVEVISVT